VSVDVGLSDTIMVFTPVGVMLIEAGTGSPGVMPQLYFGDWLLWH
jgi:hypothetical protein